MSSPPPQSSSPPPPLPQSPLPWQYGGSSSESDCLPSLKKQKVDEEDGVSSDCESEQPLSPLSDISLPDWDIEELMEDLFCPIDPNDKKVDKSVWYRYLQQIRESEGFDIKDYPGSGALTTIYPMTKYLEYPAEVEKLKVYAAKALEQYNVNNGTKYEVDRILKVNGQDFTFYITFSVKNGEDEYFQAKVVRDIDKSLDFPIVRPRVKGGLDI
ncbi:uncharacterized protein LOC125850149 [Solanum stenotomum]|uniref:uncharacterized protein LOC125850149 n=1 Tax=Solanum stenotomum TaxID=172797 RepID=UPI0020D1F3B4|nr:uncharacterized protein LOC125850149 [Solanum stenotomum]